MHRLKMSTNLFLSLLIISNVALASDYKCTIESNRLLEKTGKLSNDSFSLKGKEFVVNRKTGQTTGALSNHNTFGKPEVLDYGSKEQAFQTITIYHPIVSVDFLYVAEYEEGKIKPFLYVDAVLGVISGTCIEY